MTQNWPDQILRHPTRFCVIRKALPAEGVTQMTQKHPPHLVLLRPLAATVSHEATGKPRSAAVTQTVTQTIPKGRT